MLEVGDKVVVTGVVRDTLGGIEVGKVGEIIAVDYSYYTKEPYLVDFGDCKWWAGRDFIVEKLEEVETGETPSEGEIKGAGICHSVNVIEDNVGEALTVEEVIKSVIEGNACGNKPNKAPTTDKEDTSKVGEDNGESFWEKGGQVFALGESFKSYIEESKTPRRLTTLPEEGVYSTIIKKGGLTIYTNYSVDIVGEVVRVGGVDNLVSHLVESEDAALEED